MSVRDAWARVEVNAPVEINTRYGDVLIDRLQFVEDADGGAHIEVYVDDPDGGDPCFRIFNPPCLVRDSLGEVVRESGRRTVRRYREDPLAAVAEAIAANGGARR